jgi:hypothetical protein
MAGRLALRLGYGVIPGRQSRCIWTLPEPGPRGAFRLSDEYVTTATDDVAQQLSKAGVRLAFVLNNALGKQ